MKRKDSKTCRRVARKRGSQSAVTVNVTEVEEPVLAIGEHILFGDYWANKALGTGNNEDDSDHEKSIIQATYLKAHIPVCPETKLAQRFISLLGKLHMQAGWYLLVPSYIGSSKEIDLAAQAVTTAIESQQQKSGILARSACHRYGEALTALRQTIDFTDASLMAVALLGLYEGTMRMHTPAQFSHQYGIAKIMLSRKQNPSGPTELERALLYADWDRRFRAPAALGIVSPFEDPYWLNAQPRQRHSPPEIVKLRMLTNRLYICLPRLILYVRQLRTGGEGGVTYIREETKKLADALLDLNDPGAESFLLHGVKIVQTKDQWDIPIIRYSFQYQTLQQMVFATAYWHARLLLMQLCLKILAVPTAPQITLSQSDEELRSETKRALTNVFMSYQFSKTLSMLGDICIAQPLVASFGAISCLDRWQELPISSVKKWIVLRFNDSWGKWGRAFGSRHLEEINEVFSGGPLEGILPRIYEEERRLIEVECRSVKDDGSSPDSHYPD
jgi:hypothetical protein